MVNGSNSKDDFRIVRWEWRREPASLAAGKILGHSDRTPLLRLTDMVPGHYLFALKVRKAQPTQPKCSVTRGRTDWNPKCSDTLTCS